MDEGPDSSWFRAASVQAARSRPFCPIAIEGRKVVCGVYEGRPFAFDSACPHKGGPLELGDLVEGGKIRCPWHAFEFDVFSGDVLLNPFSPRYGRWRESGRLMTFPAKIQDGFIFVQIQTRVTTVIPK